MKFTVLVAADLYSSKVNLELTFPSFPTLADLHRLVESTFAVEASALRPSGHPFTPFKVSRFHMFDDRTEQWVDLVSSSQLVEWAQLYAFQRNREGGEEQKSIPPARLPTSASIASTMGSPVPMPSPGHSSVDYSGSYVSPPRRGGSPASHVAAPISTSQFDKVKTVFDELDVNHNGAVDVGEFSKVLSALDITFTSASVSQLFGRADSNNDGQISYQEFQAFASWYPTLVDCIYYRRRDFWEDRSKQQQVRASADAVEEARQKHAKSKHAHQEVLAEVEAQEKKVQRQEVELQEKIARERDQRAAVAEAKQELERAMIDKQNQEQELGAGRDKERQRQMALAEMQRGTEGARRRVQMQEAELAKAQEKERQLAALLAEAQREVENNKKALDSTSAELDQWRDREHETAVSLDEAQRDAARLADRLAAAERNVQNAVEKERMSEAQAVEEHREAVRSAQRREEEERELKAQRERELHHSHLIEEARRRVVEMEDSLKALEKEFADAQERRKATQQREQPLLEEEIRLREQRFQLEEKEQRLKSDTASFFESARRHSTAPVAHSASRTSVGAVDNNYSTRLSPPRPY